MKSIIFLLGLFLITYAEIDNGYGPSGAGQSPPAGGSAAAAGSAGAASYGDGQAPQAGGAAPAGASPAGAGPAPTGTGPAAPVPTGGAAPEGGAPRAPPAHQPKIDVAMATNAKAGFSPEEFYGAQGTKVAYPLPDCFTNESGFMCCNAELLDEMHKAYDELRNKPDWISCNIQAITNRVQKRAEARFGLPFETVTGISDYASKVHFYHNYICKLEREGRIILAYASPTNAKNKKNAGVERKVVSRVRTQA